MANASLAAQSLAVNPTFGHYTLMPSSWSVFQTVGRYVQHPFHFSLHKGANSVPAAGLLPSYGLNTLWLAGWRAGSEADLSFTPIFLQIC